MKRMIATGLILCLAVAGCGDSDEVQRAEVTGTVSYDGEPVEQGTITLVPDVGNEGSGTGGPISGGQYSIAKDKGPTPGTYLVQIVGRRKTGREIPAGPPAPEGATVPEIESYIPAQFNTQTTLTLNVDSGTIEKNFELQSAATP